MTDLYKGTFIINANPNNEPGPDPDPDKNSRCNIASFDLDTAIIRQRWDNDWNIIYGAERHIKKLYVDNYKIVIFTHQSNSKFNIKEFKDKVYEISKKLDVPIQVIGCTDTGYSKKPSIGLWKLLEKNNSKEISLSNSFYVGDSAGRNNDSGDADIKFAINIGIKYYTPDEYYDNCKIKITAPVHPLDMVKTDRNPIDYSCFETDTKKMIILVGPPSCGKSTWCKKEVFKNFEIFDQDKYKIKLKMLNTVNKTLENNISVIIDKRNETDKDRKELIEIAEKHNTEVIIVWFDIPINLCKHLCAYREIMTGKEIPSIIISKYYSNNKENNKPNEVSNIKLIVKNFDISELNIKNKEIFESFLI